MNQRTYERRQSRAMFYDFPLDRRRAVDRRDQPAVEPAMPGMIRPGANEVPPARERRRVPGSGDE